MNLRTSKITDAQLLAAVPHARNIRQLLLALGVAGYGGNYEVVRARLAALNVEEPRFARRPRSAAPPRVSTEELSRVVAVADSYAQVVRLLGWESSASAQRRVKRLVQKAGLDTAHFLGRSAMRGLRQGGRRPESLETLLVAGRRLHTSNLRERLVSEGVLTRECAVCGRDEWQDEPIPLELDHINGDRSDNRLENLRLLCPNCHARTDTYRGRNIGAPPVRPASPAGGLPANRARRRLSLVLPRRTS